MRKSSEGRMHNNPTDDVEVRYSHIIKVITDWIDTTNLVVVGGRGLAKSTYKRAGRPIACMTCPVRRWLSWGIHIPT